MIRHGCLARRFCSHDYSEAEGESKARRSYLCQHCGLQTEGLYLRGQRWQSYSLRLLRAAGCERQADGIATKPALLGYYYLEMLDLAAYLQIIYSGGIVAGCGHGNLTLRRLLGNSNQKKDRRRMKAELS